LHYTGRDLSVIWLIVQITRTIVIQHRLGARLDLSAR